MLQDCGATEIYKSKMVFFAMRDGKIKGKLLYIGEKLLGATEREGRINYGLGIFGGGHCFFLLLLPGAEQNHGNSVVNSGGVWEDTKNHYYRSLV